VFTIPRIRVSPRVDYQLTPNDNPLLRIDDFAPRIEMRDQMSSCGHRLNWTGIGELIPDYH